MSSTVAEIEEAAFAAWPAEETIESDGWILRSARGFSRRLNSVAPHGPSQQPLDVKVSLSRSWYERRGLPLLFRMTPLVDPDVGPSLQRIGFSEEGRTLVMDGPIPETSAPPCVAIAERPDETWTAGRLLVAEVDEDVADAWAAIIGRVPAPAAFAAASTERELTAAGFGVVSGSLLGIFEVIVKPARRRRGFARQLMEALFAWGRESGATRTYLQVVASNGPAVALYHGFGLAPRYEYRYLREPRSAVVANASARSTMERAG